MNFPNHISVYQSSNTSGANYTQINAVSDGTLPQVSNSFFLPAPAKIPAMAAVGATLTNFRLNVPSYRNIAFPEFINVKAAATATTPYPIIDLTNTPYLVPASEPIEVDVIQSSGGAETDSVIVAWQFGERQPVYGNIITIRCTAAITIAAGSWASGTLTPSQTLQTGRYIIVGMAAFGTNLLAARLISPQNMNRPGCPGFQVGATYAPDTFRYGNLGAFAEIITPTFPNLECIGVGAGSAQTVLLDIIKVG